MAFKMTVEHEVTIEEAMTAADEVERAVGEICNGKRKPGSIPMQEMCSLVQFVRDSAKRANVNVTGATQLHRGASVLTAGLCSSAPKKGGE